MKKWAGRLLKISIVILVFLAISLTMLVNMGGSSDTLKGAIEDYLVRATGYQTTIETLNKMSFYPYIGIDVEGIEMVSPADPEKGISVEKALLKLGFWDMMLSKKVLKNLQVSNAVFSSETAFEKRLSIETFGLEETPDEKAFLQVVGDVEGIPLNATMELSYQGSAKRRKYQLAEESAVEFDLGDMSVSAILKPRALGGFHVSDFLMTQKDVNVLTGAFYFLRDTGQKIDMKGYLESAQTGAATEADLGITFGEENIMMGSLDAQYFTMEDFEDGSRLMQFIQSWNDVFAGEPLDLDINLAADRYKDGEEEKTDAKLHITRSETVLEVSPLTE